MFGWFKKKEPTVSPLVYTILDSWVNTPGMWDFRGRLPWGSSKFVVKSKTSKTMLVFGGDSCFVYNPDYTCSKFEHKLLREEYIQIAGDVL